MAHLRGVWNALGPGLTTGAADDDPSGIATYSQAGAQFGFALTWTMFLTPPFMVAIQIISACIGWKTRSGLAKNIAVRLSPVVLYLLVALVRLSLLGPPGMLGQLAYSNHLHTGLGHGVVIFHNTSAYADCPHQHGILIHDG